MDFYTSSLKRDANFIADKLSGLDMEDNRQLNFLIEELEKRIKIKTKYRTIFSTEENCGEITYHIDLLTQFKNTCTQIIEFIPDSRPRPLDIQWREDLLDMEIQHLYD